MTVARSLFVALLVVLASTLPAADAEWFTTSWDSGGPGIQPPIGMTTGVTLIGDRRARLDAWSGPNRRHRMVVQGGEWQRNIPSPTSFALESLDLRWHLNAKKSVPLCSAPVVVVWELRPGDYQPSGIWPAQHIATGDRLMLIAAWQWRYGGVWDRLPAILRWIPESMAAERQDRAHGRPLVLERVDLPYAGWLWRVPAGRSVLQALAEPGNRLVDVREWIPATGLPPALGLHAQASGLTLTVDVDGDGRSDHTRAIPWPAPLMWPAGSGRAAIWAMPPQLVLPMNATSRLTVAWSEPAITRPQLILPQTLITTHEAIGILQIPLQLSAAHDHDVRISWRQVGAADHTAVAAFGGEVVFPAGVTTTSIDLPIRDDSVHGEQPVAIIELLPPAEVDGPEDARITIIIADDDLPPTLIWAGLAPDVREGDGMAILLAGLSHASREPIHATVTNLGPGLVPVVDAVIFPPGETVVEIPCAVTDDVVYGGDATVIMRLQADPDAPVTAAPPAELTIVVIDDDPIPTVTMTAAELVLLEGEMATVSIQRIGACTLPIHVVMALEPAQGGTNAVSNADFTQTFWEGIIPADQDRLEIEVHALVDHLAEGDQTGILRLVAATLDGGLPAQLGNLTQIDVLVRDADAAAAISFREATTSARESQGVVRIDLKADLPSEHAVTAEYVLETSDRLRDLSQGRVVFRPGETAAFITLRTVDDHIWNEPIAVSVRIERIFGADLGTLAHHSVLLSDDDGPGVAIAWHALARELIARNSFDPPMASRCLALLGVSQRQALRELPPTLYAPSMRIAVASAFIMRDVFPSDDAAIERLAQNDQTSAWWNLALAEDPTGPESAREASRIVLNRRSGDGHSLPWYGSIPTGPHHWYASWEEARLPQRPNWSAVEPWFLLAADQFRPGPPPVPGTMAFAEALAEVRHIADTRTAEQLAIAGKWSDGPGTETPPGHWNAIACQAIDTAALSDREAVRVLAVLGAGLMDAGIATWDCKYSYWSIRPYQVDPAITTPLGQPNFPSYVSGHSTYSGCASRILGHFIPAQAEHFAELAEQAALSRLYGGVHYRFDNDVGLSLGHMVADWILIDESDGSWRSDGLPIFQVDHAIVNTDGRLSIDGQVLPGLHGVLQQVRATLDRGRGRGAEAIALTTIPTVGGGIHFVVVDTPALLEGNHTLTLIAESTTGPAHWHHVLRLDPDGPPNLVIDAPQAGQLFPATNSVQISGRSDQSLRRLVIQGAEVPVNAVDGGWAFAVDLTVEYLRQSNRPLVLTTGINRVDIFAEDWAGNIVHRRHEIEIDGDAPLLIVDAPTEAESIVGPSVIVTGSVRDVTLRTGPLRNVTVTVDGEEVAVVHGTFTATVAVPVAEEENEGQDIVIVARDDVGNERRLIRRVRRSDPVGYQLRNLSQPLHGACGAEATEIVLLEVIDPHGGVVPQQPVSIRVALGEGMIAPGAGDVWSRTVTLLSDADGRIACRWRLGGRAGRGTQQLRARALGGTHDLRVDADARPGAVAQVLVVEGHQQSVAVGIPAGKPLDVRVVDAFNNTLEGVRIEWSISLGAADLKEVEFEPLGNAFQFSDAIGRGRASIIARHAGDVIIQARVPGAENPALFYLRASEPGPIASTSLSGSIVDAGGRPFPGISVLVDGSTLGSRTDADGRFRITGISPGHRHLMVVGATRGSSTRTLPTLGFEIEVAPGIANEFPGRIVVPELDDSLRTWVGGDEAVDIPMPGRQGWFIRVEAHATIRADGQRGPAQMFIAPVNPTASPMPVPDGERAAGLATLQPPGIRFDPPARIFMPNDIGEHAGAELVMRSYDHDLGDWVSSGWCRVTEDRTQIETISGSGIVKSGWHFGAQPSTVTALRGHTPPVTATSSPPDDDSGLTADASGVLRGDLWREAVIKANVQARSGTAQWSWTLSPGTQAAGTIVAPAELASAPEIHVAWSLPSQTPEDTVHVALQAQSGSDQASDDLAIRVAAPKSDVTLLVPGQTLWVRLGPVPDLAAGAGPELYWRPTAETPVSAGVRIDEDQRTLPPVVADTVEAGSIAIRSLETSMEGGQPWLDVELQLASDVLPGVVDVGFAGHGISPAQWQVGTVPITVTAPPVAECLPRRRGTWDDPAIILEADASLEGSRDGGKDRWRLRAAAAGADAFSWDLGSGVLLQGTRQSSEIVVRYGLGRHAPVLVTTKRIDGRVYAAKASIHHLVVLDGNAAVDSTPPLPVAITDPFGSPVTAARAATDDLGRASLPVWLASTGETRLRVSPDGYPQNEYWLGPEDATDPPLRLALKPGGVAKVFVQGYGNPSSMVNDAHLQAQASAIPSSLALGDAMLSTVALSIAVDADGDNQLRFDDSDRTSPDRPFRFWLNDDQEELGTSGDIFYGDRRVEQDVNLARAGSGNDARDEVIRLRRDLEDLFPLNVRLDGPPEIVHAIIDRLFLNWHLEDPRQNGSTAASALRLFASADPAGTLRYLADHQGVSRAQVEDVRYATGVLNRGLTEESWFGTRNETQDLGWYVSDSVLLDHWKTQGHLALLAEGIQGDGGRIRLSALSPLLGEGTRLHAPVVHVALSSFKDWYSVTTVDPPGLTATGANPGTLIRKQTASSQLRSAQAVDTVVWIHGYNMPPLEKIWFRETTFKRLWWNGWRGRMHAFEWPSCWVETLGYPGAVGDPEQSYNGFARSETTALLAGERLAGAIREWRQRGEIPSGHSLHLIAHSHGNVVVPSALQRLPPGSVDTWIALQAAIPVQAFGGTGPFPAVTLPRNKPNVIGGAGWVGDRLGFPAEATGLDTPDLWPGYFQSLPGVNRIVSFFNVNDWPLSPFLWEYANLRKPTMGWGGGHSYAYLRDPVPDPQAFPHGAPDGDTSPLQRFARVNTTLKRMEGGRYQDAITLHPLAWLDEDAGGLRTDWARIVAPELPPWMSVGATVLTGNGSLNNQQGLFSSLHHVPRFLRGETDPYDMNDPTYHTYHLEIGSAAPEKQRHRQYEILAYAVESRCRPLGAVDMEAEGSNSPLAVNPREQLINAHDLWNGIADDQTGRPSSPGENVEKEYAHHIWHSAEMLTTLSQQWKFWAEVATRIGVQEDQTLYSVGVER